MEDSRIAELTIRVAKLEADTIGLRTLVNAMAMHQMGRNAVTVRKSDDDVPEMTPEREAAVQSLAGGIDITHLKFLNPHCIVGKTVCRNRYAVKVTRATLTLAKYQQPPEVSIALSTELRNLLFK